MSEMEDKINQVLSSPDSMDKIMSIAKSLGLTGGGASASEPEHHADESAEPVQETMELTQQSGTESASVLDMFEHVDPKMMSTALELMGEYNNKGDRRISLLNALGPYLKENDRPRIDKATQIVKLAKVIKKAMRSFSGGAEDV